MLNENNQIIRPTNNPQLISKSEAEINTLVLRLQYVKGGVLKRLNMAKRLKNQCTQLHQSLKEIYHLD
jgi:hypothetical protein